MDKKQEILARIDQYFIDGLIQRNILNRYWYGEKTIYEIVGTRLLLEYDNGWWIKTKRFSYILDHTDNASLKEYWKTINLDKLIIKAKEVDP